MLLGKDLANARDQAGLTQAELGDLLGVTGRTIRDWERTNVPRHKEQRVLDLERLWNKQSASPLTGYSDARLVAEIAALVAELASRLDDSRAGLDSRPMLSAEDSEPVSGTSRQPGNSEANLSAPDVGVIGVPGGGQLAQERQQQQGNRSEPTR